MKPIIKFQDESKSFAVGVEFGRLLNKMENRESPIDNCGFPVRLENRKVIQDACDYYGYIPIFSECIAKGWIEFTAIKGEAEHPDK